MLPGHVPGPGAGAPAQPSIEDDWKTIKQVWTTLEKALLVLAFAFPPATTLLGDQQRGLVWAIGASWPLILGIAVTGIGIMRIPIAGMPAVIFGGFVLLVSTFISSVVAGVEIPTTGVTGSSPVAMVEQILASYAEAYGPILFLTAIMAGVGVIYLWVTIAERRLGINQ